MMYNVYYNTMSQTILRRNTDSTPRVHMRNQYIVAYVHIYYYMTVVTVLTNPAIDRLESLMLSRRCTILRGIETGV